MSRNAFIDRDQKLLLFWTAKVGCTSLAHWFVIGALGKEPGFVRETKYSGPREWLEGEGHSVDYREALRLATQEGYETCVIARHPVARAISGYIDKFVMHLDRPLDSFHSLEDFAAREYRHWKGRPCVIIGRPYEGLTFLEFLRFIREAIDSRKGGEARLNHHWNTQVPFYFREHAFRYDHVFRLENFSEMIAWLCARYGVETEIPHRKNTTTYGSEKCEDVPNMPSLELCRKPELLLKENFMTPAALEIIRDAYAIDFEYFGYDPESL